MGNILYLAGIAIAGSTGYNGLGWPFIFISSLIMAIGYCIIRAPQIHGLTTGDGVFAVPKILLLQSITLSVVTAPVFFIAAAFN
jgi:hypothetical protein